MLLSQEHRRTATALRAVPFDISVRSLNELHVGRRRLGVVLDSSSHAPGNLSLPMFDYHIAHAHSPSNFANTLTDATTGLSFSHPHPHPHRRNYGLSIMTTCRCSPLFRHTRLPRPFGLPNSPLQRRPASFQESVVAKGKGSCGSQGDHLAQ